MIGKSPYSSKHYPLRLAQYHMKRTLIAILLAFPCLYLAQPNPTIQAFEAEKLFLKGRTFFDTGDIRSAVSIFDQVIALDPGHLSVFEMRGEAHYALGNYSQALADYQESARQQPSNAELRNSMGVTAAKLNMYNAANAYFNEALQIDPSHAAATDNLALTQQRLSQQDPFQQGPFQGGTVASGTPRPGKNPALEQVKNEIKNPGTGFNPRPSTTTPGQKMPTPSIPTVKPRFPQTYTSQSGKIKVGDQTDPFLRITKIEVTQTSTKVHFELESTSTEAFPVMLDDKSGSNPLYITDQNMRQTFQLKRIIGLPNWPKEVFMLPPGRTVPFVAEFEKIRDDMYSFHILEGRKERKGSWDFWDIKVMD